MHHISEQNDIGNVTVLLENPDYTYIKKGSSLYIDVATMPMTVDGVGVSLGDTVFISKPNLGGIYQISRLPEIGNSTAQLLLLYDEKCNIGFTIERGITHQGSRWVRLESKYICLYTGSNIKTVLGDDERLSEIDTILSTISCDKLKGLGKLDDYIASIQRYKEIGKYKKETAINLNEQTGTLRNINETLMDLNKHIKSAQYDDSSLITELYDLVLEMQSTSQHLNDIKQVTTSGENEKLLNILESTHRNYGCLRVYSDEVSQKHSGVKCKSQKNKSEFIFRYNLNAIFDYTNIYSCAAPCRYHDHISKLKASWAHSPLTDFSTLFNIFKSLFNRERLNISDCDIVTWLERGDFAQQCFTLDEIKGIVSELKQNREYRPVCCNVFTKGESIGSDVHIEINKKVRVYRVYLTQY